MPLLLPDREPGHVALLALRVDDVLDARVVGRGALPQLVDVVEVVPLVVQFLVVFEHLADPQLVFVLALDRLPVHPADVTEVILVVLNQVVLGTQLCEPVREDVGDYALEQLSEEYRVD